MATPRLSRVLVGLMLSFVSSACIEQASEPSAPSEELWGAMDVQPLGDENPPAPVPTKRTCGGYYAKRCPYGFLCVDDPEDTCDPKNRGADCPGVCILSDNPSPPPRNPRTF